MTVSKFDIEVAARTLAMEARGEPLEGQQAVGYVIRNRLRDGRWGKSLSSVCLWNRHIKGGGQVFQFSGWAEEDPNFVYACNLPDDDATLDHMRSVMQAALDSPTDPTQGATHYFAISIPDPPWVAGATLCGQFGHQRFYRGVK